MTHYYTDAPTWTTAEVNFLSDRADKAEKELAETRTLLAQRTVDLKTATDTLKKRRCRHCGVVAPSETAEEERIQDEMWAEFDVRRRREAARDEAERRRKAAVEAGAVEWVSGVVWR